MELLAPAGTIESARSAVHNGADAIYVGGKILNARRAAKGFSGEELKELVTYCRLRNVKVYVTVNTLTREDELGDLLELAEEIAKAGVDAAIVSDLGVARILQRACPSLPLHASTQMNIHSPAGVQFLEKMGFKRVVLARELSLSEIETICKSTTMEIEVFAHGALCMCYSGNCYFSAVVGQKSGNRGLCAQPCRLPYGMDRYPLSLKDLCVLEHLNALKKAGVTSLKIEGRLKSPEYVGSVCNAYRRVLDGAPPTSADIDRLAHIFSRNGFTSDYLLDQPGPQMFGIKSKTEYIDYKKAIEQVTKTLADGYETKKRTLSFHLFMREDLCRLTVRCEDFEAEFLGDPPQPAIKKEVTEEDAIRALSKLGGTPFEAGEITALVRHDLFYPASAFNALRRKAISAVEEHFAPIPHPFSPILPAMEDLVSQGSEPILEGWFWNAPKVNPDRRLARYWLNAAKESEISPFATDRRAGVFFPAVMNQSDLEKMANRLYTLGFRRALCRNIGQVAPLRSAGFEVHGDFSFNAANSQTLSFLKGEVASLTLSYELTLRQIRKLKKPLPCGIIVYGRLPLMQTKNCILKNIGPCRNGKGGTLTDRTGRSFPIACDHSCQNVMFNSTPLFLADRNREWKESNISFARLIFTDESINEINHILDAYTNGGEPPELYTRGLYYRGVL